ncbi:MAG: DUF4097 family beta strand repeat protein [Clostridia bacterium]|nr:DUF4097 family beta strand repeat protein [Clostridia bacterium]
MRTFQKTALIVASMMLGVGLIVSAFALILTGCDFEKLDTENFETKTYEVTEEFQNIDISGLESDIRFVHADDGQCKIVCKESENIFCNIFVDNGTLTVKRKDVREGIMRGVFWEEELEITVYLPKNRYKTVSLHTMSGDIKIPMGFYFDHLSAETTSGSIFAEAVTDREASLKSVSGDMTFVPFGNATTSDSVKMETTSGDITVRSVNTKKFDLQTVSGDISFDRIYSNTLNLETTSGDAEFESIEFYEKMTLKTTSGDVEGSVLSAKHFKTKTVSGDIRVPSSDANAPIFEIQTTSGDIEITVEAGE